MTERRRDLTRRSVSAALILTPLAAASVRLRAAEATPIEIWTGPACSCCQDWIKHLETNSFNVTRHDGGNSDARKRLGMPVDFGSCHTGAVAGFAIEGHVPAPEIRRLLEEQPDAVGLAVPSMPRGSPGMDGPEYGGAKDPYDVFLIKRDGSAVIYKSYR